MTIGLDRKPLELTSPRVWRTYTGGSLLDCVHGVLNTKDSHFPEEWILSTVTAINPNREHIREGLCSIKNLGVTLDAFIKESPSTVLGKCFYDKKGATTGILVKLIDAAERLTVQVHPDKGKALSLFNSRFGKTECWHILGGRSLDGEPPYIYFGFKEGITMKAWKRCFDQQDISRMLDMMHKIEVHPGETFLIEGGVPHAIGKGCFLLEIQEPTDYTIRIERVTPKGFKISDFACHQGLGFDKMFDCFNYQGLSFNDVLDKWKIQPEIICCTDDYVKENVIGYRNTDCFSLDEYTIKTGCTIEVSDVFSGIYVLDGCGEIVLENGECLQLFPGSQYLVPANIDSFRIQSTSSVPLALFRFFGPR